MSHVSSIRVNKTSYNVAQAPANEQKKLISLVGAKVALSSAMAEVNKIDTDLLLGSLIVMPEDLFDEIASIVLYKTVVKNGDTVVDIGDFQDNVTEYYLLVAKAIEANLKDFFTYLDSVNKKTKLAQKKA